MGEEEAAAYKSRWAGVLPRQDFKAAFEAKVLEAGLPPIDGQFQPASLDLRPGSHVTCVKQTFLPEPGESIEELIQREGVRNYDFELEDARAKGLNRRQIYLIPFEERVSLPEQYCVEFNPKSTTGRTDCLTRVITENVPKFDTIEKPGNYKLWLEITPLSFDVRIKRGTPLTQMRMRCGTSRLTEKELADLYGKTPLLYDPDGRPIPLDKVRMRNGGIELTADLGADIVAYRSRQDSDLDFDLSLPKGALFDRRFKFYDAVERSGRSMLIEPDPNFYLLGTWEQVRVPPNLCGTLLAYDVTSAEARIHYAGFFDPGFFAPATLEVRGFHRAFRIVDRQPICMINFEWMRSPPMGDDGRPALYGKGLGSNYQGQSRGPNLPKQMQPMK